VELQNFKKMTDLLAENFKSFWKNVFCERFSELFFRKTYRQPPPPQAPPSVANIFREKFLLSGGPGIEGGPNFGLHPPNQKPVGTALLDSKYGNHMLCTHELHSYLLVDNRGYACI
jgi:hypothetical protein